MNSSFAVIAERFRRAGQPEKAVALCREGLASFPDHLSARVTLGWSLLDLGEDRAAFAELKTVVAKAPDNLAAIRGLAELHERGITADTDGFGGESPAFDEPITIEDVAPAGSSARVAPPALVALPAPVAPTVDILDFAPVLASLPAPAPESEPATEPEPATDAQTASLLTPDAGAEVGRVAELESTAAMPMAPEPLFFIPAPSFECAPAPLQLESRAAATDPAPINLGVPLAFSPTPGEPVRYVGASAADLWTWTPPEPPADPSAERLTVFASESIDPELDVPSTMFAIEDVMPHADDTLELVLDVGDFDDRLDEIGDTDLDAPADLTNWLDRVRARRSALVEYAAG